MKKIKITLPEGGQRKCKNGVVLDLNKGTVFEIDAAEMVIEGNVSLIQATAQSIPFDLEAAKAGAQVLWGDDPVRWVGRGNDKSSIQAFNIIEHSEGLAYAPDKDLFMAPKPRRTVWVNLYREHSSAYYESAEEARNSALPDAIARAVPIEV